MKLLVSTLLALSCIAPVAQAQEKISHGRFKDVLLYRPKGEVKTFALLFSGNSGWGTSACRARYRPPSLTTTCAGITAFAVKNPGRRTSKMVPTGLWSGRSATTSC